MNVEMGDNAVISWDRHIKDKPYIPTLPNYIQATKITSTTIESPNITGGTISADTTIDVGTDLKVGNNIWLNANDDGGRKSIVFNGNASIEFSSNGVLTLSSRSGIDLGSFATYAGHEIANKDWVKNNVVAKFA